MVCLINLIKGLDNDFGYGDVFIVGMVIFVVSQWSFKIFGKFGVMVYGVVMYDFQVECGDELDVKVGEVIIVIVQFNLEWFVVKLIGRFGGFGLIFVFFVEI